MSIRLKVYPIAQKTEEAEGGEVQPDPSSMTIQERVEHFFHTVFGKWGLLVSEHPCKVFWLSMLFFIVLSGGMAMRANFEDEQTVWTPADNNSIKARDKSSQLFPAKGRFLSLIAEVKDPSDESASVINLEVLEEVKKFVDDMIAAEVNINGTMVKYTDICNKIGSECFGSESLL